MSYGYVSRIELENFMCHRKFEIDLHDQMNIIVGRNGSGKSSILTALVIGLGGGARTTGRGSKMTELIRHGMRDAYINLTIKHLSRSAVLAPYGDTFTIQRRIGTKSSSWSIRNKDGKVVSTKAADVRSICVTLGFHPDNVLLMLNQESAKEFLVTATPQLKYDRLTTALRVDGVTRANLLCEERLAREGSIGDDIRKQLNIMISQVGADQKKLRVLQQAEESIAKIKELDCVLKWRDVRKFEFMVQKYETELAKIDAAGNESRHHEIRQLLSANQQEIQELTAELDNKVQANTLLEDDLNGFKQQVSLADLKVAEARKIREKVQNEFDNAKAKLEKVLSDHAKNNTSNVKSEKLSELYRERANLNRRQKLLDQEEEELAEEAQRFSKERDNSKNTVRATASNIDGLQQEIALLQRNLKDLENRGERDPLSGFGQHAAEIRSLDKMIDNARWTKARPVGPLGRYIYMKAPEFSPLVETILSKVSWMYWVQNRDDAVKMNELARRTNIPVVVLQWQEEMFSYSQLRSDHNYARFSDLVTTEYQYIDRILVDQMSNEKDAFCDTIEKALRARDISEVRSVYYPDKRGSYRCISKRDRVSDSRTIFASYDRIQFRTVATSSDDAKAVIVRNIEGLREQIETAKTEHKSQKEADRVIDRKASACSENLARVRKEITLIKSHLNKIEADLHKTEEIKDDDEDEVDIAVFTASQERTVTRKQLVLDNVKRMVDDRTKEKMACEANVSSKQEEINALLGDRRDIEKRMRALRIKAGDFERELSQFEHERRTKERFLRDFGDKLMAATAEQGKAQVVAEEFGERPNLESFDHMDNAQLMEEKTKLQAQAEEVARAHIDLAAKRQELEEAEAGVQILSKHSEEFEKRLAEEERSYKRRRLNSKMHFASKLDDIKRDYAEFIQERNFTGELIIKQKKDNGAGGVTAGTLEANANPAQGTSDRSAKTLSGGEKSFTQICLLLSIWKNINTRLVAMDEYDVFMDEVFRAASMESLIKTITAKGAQGILITPQGLPRAVVEKFQGNSELFKVHNLENPRP